MSLARALQGGCVIGSGVLTAGHLAFGVGPAAVAQGGSALAAALGLVLGALAADLITGLVHWACDTWGDERTPWIGASVIRSFHEHHRRPLGVLSSDWIDANGQASALACPVLAAMALPAAAHSLAGRPLAYGFLLALAGLGAFANQLHQWAHAPNAPRAVRALQRRGWILSPGRHRLHHRAPHTSDYCISGGWLNRPLDAVGFWRGLERAIAHVTGAQPRAASEDRAAPARRVAKVPLARPQHRGHRDEAGRMARQGSHR